ncbi:hypothetical protein BTM361_09270 [Helicobacter pylori]
MEHHKAHTTIQALQAKRKKLLTELAELEAEIKVSSERKSSFNISLSPSFMAKVDEYMKEKGFSNRSLLFEKALEFYMLKHP